MAIVLQGFLGPFTGKVGGAVGGIWKGINYIKGYVIPANPNTAAQQAQRTKFANVVSLAQSLLSSLITSYWNPFAVKMSGYNFFIQQFINSSTSTGLAQAASVITKGTLEPTSLLTPTYDPMTGDFVFDWSPNINGNGDPVDQASVLILNKNDNSVLAYSNPMVDRSVGSHTEVLPTGLTATNLIGYVWFSRGSGSTFMISNSLGAVAAAV